jgi:plasmid stability protein
MRDGQVQPQDKFVLRMPDGLREDIKQRAAANNRSMNAEILSLIESGLSTYTPAVDNSTVELIAQRTVQLLLKAQANGG